MKNKTLYIVVFIVLAIIQLAVPMQMIYNNSNILAQGKIFKFKTQPIDPYDAFRGKYIQLNFAAAGNMVSKDSLSENKEYFAVLDTDKDGFARIAKLTTTPDPQSDYVKVKLSYIWRIENESSKDNNKFSMRVILPFDRYYMNEYKAPEAEKTYTNSLRNTKENVYAVVAVKEGEGIVKEVMIDGISIKDYVKK